MEYKDYYRSLGVSKTASEDEIQRAYRKLARKYHPDVNRDPGAEDRFKEITEAYEVLKDKTKRSTYDRYGSAWKQAGRAGTPPPGFENIRFDFGGGGGSGGSGFSSFFESLFGNRGGRSPFGGGFGDQDFSEFTSAPGGASWGRAADQEATLALTIEEAARGGTRDVTIADSMSGRSRTYSVNLPRGVRPGQKIRLSRRDEGNASGNLILKVELKPHDRLRLDGLDLHCDLPLAPWEAALGTEAIVRTLDGSVKVRIPPGTSSGRKIRLRGHGFPNPKGPDGDLFAEIKIVLPKKLEERERELFEELAKVSSFRPPR